MIVLAKFETASKKEDLLISFLVQRLYCAVMGYG